MHGWPEGHSLLLRGSVAPGVRRDCAGFDLGDRVRLGVPGERVLERARSATTSCAAPQPATLDLSCAPSAVTRAELTGPCMPPPDASLVVSGLGFGCPLASSVTAVPVHVEKCADPFASRD